MTHSTLDTVLTAAKQKRLSAPAGGGFFDYQGSGGAVLRYGLFGHNQMPAAQPDSGEEVAGAVPRGTVIFIPGRSEFAEKFFEDMHVFASLGYVVGSVDLRGQGLSYRECADRDRHVVTDFDDHVADLDHLISELEAVGAPRPYILAGHSAGSHVIFRFLHAHPGRVEWAITIAPMIDIDSGGIPRWLATRLPVVMRALGLGQAFVPGHGPYSDDPSGWQSLLTHDSERWEDEHILIRQNPDLRCGGATFAWVGAALSSIKILHQPGFAEAIQTPVLMFQAGDEQIVDNAASTAFAARLPKCQFVRIDGAAHEILKETDIRRRQLWGHITDWLEVSENG